LGFLKGRQILDAITTGVAAQHQGKKIKGTHFEIRPKKSL